MKTHEHQRQQSLAFAANFKTTTNPLSQFPLKILNQGVNASYEIAHPAAFKLRCLFSVRCNPICFRTFVCFENLPSKVTCAAARKTWSFEINFALSRQKARTSRFLKGLKASYSRIKLEKIQNFHLKQLVTLKRFQTYIKYVPVKTLEFAWKLQMMNYIYILHILWGRCICFHSSTDLTADRSHAHSRSHVSSV